MSDGTIAGLYSRLRKRRIFQWGVAYVAGAWVLLQAAELLFDIFDWPNEWLRVLTVLLAFGFLAAMVLAWYHGERGQQKLSGIEFVVLALIAAAGVATVISFEFGSSAGRAEWHDLFTGKGSTRVTADSFFKTDPSWSPDASSLVFASGRSGNNDLWLMQRNGETTQLTVHDADDLQPAWSPDGHTILFVSSRNHGSKLDRSVFFGYTFGGDIFSIPVFGGEQTLLIEDASNPAWSPDGESFAFDASHDGPRRIWVSDKSGNARRRISDDDSNLAIHIRPAWSPDGQWVVYERQPGTQASAGALVLQSIDGDSTFDLTDGSHRDMAPAWAGNNTIVFASDRGGSLNLWQLHFNPDKPGTSSIPGQITLGAGEDFDPAIASDGTLAYTTLRRLQNLWQVDVEPDTLTFGKEPRRLMHASWNDFAPALSSDNLRTAFSSDRSAGTDIWLLVDGETEPTRLTELAGQDLQPVWSPDDSKLAFFSDTRGSNDIWVMSLAGGPPAPLTPQQSNDVNPYWSPDGRKFGFTSDRSGQSEVWTMNIDGSDAKKLTDIGVLGHTARWSPDGEWLLFTSVAEGDRDVYAVSADGSETRRLTSAPTQDAHGLWSPDGTQVLYLADHQQVYARPFSPESEAVEHRLVFDLGETIDFVHLSVDGTQFQFTRQNVESDLWFIE